MNRPLFYLLAALVCLMAACGSDDDTPVRCVEGEAAACICADGPSVGVQICNPDGVFDSCDCSGTVSPTPMDAGTEPSVDMGSDPVDMGSGPVDMGTDPDTGSENDAGDPDMGSDPDMGPTFVNLCGGTDILDVQPGTPCGDCGDGITACRSGNTTECLFASSLNACGGCVELTEAPGDACGPCGLGTLQCDGNGLLECSGATSPNACGGCSSLPEQPGFFCTNTTTGKTGAWTCTSSDTVRCSAPDENACGGTSQLTEVPASACGACGDGRFECASLDALICNGGSTSQNACGGCGTPLVGQPNTACGACGGVWQCDGDQAVACSQRINPCGGCTDLTVAPGSDCGGGEIATCNGPLATECRDAAVYNACGGTNLLANQPGASCGTCGDGIYICVGTTGTACAEADISLNACGGCAPLKARPGDPCAPGSSWTCDGTDDVVCTITPPNNPQINACGGTDPLPGEPGDACDECGRWVCDVLNPNLTFCVAGSTGTMTDEDNCGMCGNRCLPGETCSSGSCVFDKAVQIDWGATHHVVRFQGGEVRAWGETRSAVGNGTNASGVSTPTAANIINDAIHVSGGGDFNRPTTCAVRANGDVWCWGDNFYGQFGVGSSVIGGSSVPLKVPGIDNAIRVDVETSTVCALKSDFTLWCWGQNGNGQLGRGTLTTSEPTPAQVPGIGSVQDFAIGGKTVCAVNSQGKIYCWGENGEGAVGIGTRTPTKVSTPTEIVGGGTGYAEVEATGRGFIARGAGGVYRWGVIINVGSSDTPVVIPNTLSATRIFGAFNGVFIEYGPGDLRYSGFDRGRTGDTATAGGVVTDRPVLLPSGVLVDIAGRDLQTVVLMDDGSLWVAGSRNYLGDGGPNIINGYSVVFHPVPSVLPVRLETGNCDDGFDNDEDGLTDCQDPDCAFDAGTAEGANAFTATIDAYWFPYQVLSCFADSRYVDNIVRWTAPRTARFEVNSGASGPDLAIEVRNTCDTSVSSVTCNNNEFIPGATDPTTVQFDAVGGQEYFFYIDARTTGALSLDITEVP